MYLDATDNTTLDIVLIYLLLYTLVLFQLMIITIMCDYYYIQLCVVRRYCARITTIYTVLLDFAQLFVCMCQIKYNTSRTVV